MFTLKCVKCNNKIYKYKKIGKGRLWHCWKDRIIEDYTIKEGYNIKCTCGNLIGIDEGKFVKLKQHSFIKSGSITKN